MTKIVTFPDGFSSATEPTLEVLTKADVGLDQVDNTSDVNKPVSTAQAAAIALAIANLVDSAPVTLDTLNELAAALGDDPNFATTMATSLGLRLRVDTAAQGLTGTEKTNAKTNIGLENVANVDTTNPANITQDSTHRFVTDAEKTAWNASSAHQDTYANLVTYAATASDSQLCFSTDTKILYYVVGGVLQEIALMKTINGTITQAQITVGTSAARATVAGTAPNANRKRLIFQPSTSNTGTIYYGGSGVTTSNGTPIIGPDKIVLDWDASDYYLISDTAGQTVSIIEVV